MTTPGRGTRWSVLRLTNRLATRAPCAGLSRALAIEDVMGRLILTAILLAIVTPAAAQTADRLYLMDCGHNSAKDQARWSPGVAKAARKYVAVTDRATHPHKPLRLTRLAVRSY